MNKKVVILFGPPGAGKGTQAELLSDKLGLFLIETSTIGEKKIAMAKPGEFVEVDGEKFYFEKEKELWETGKLWDPPFVVSFINEKINELFSEGKSIIFTGSPRTIYEAEKVAPVIEKLYGKENIAIFVLGIKPETTIFRNSHRKICELMRHSILSNKETEKLTICPLDGSKLMTRKLDDPKAIKVRLEEYDNRTAPVIEYFEKNGFNITRINGDQSVANVFTDISKAVK